MESIYITYVCTKKTGQSKAETDKINRTNFFKKNKNKKKDLHRMQKNDMYMQMMMRCTRKHKKKNDKKLTTGIRKIDGS